MLYIHRLSHNIMMVAVRCGVNLLLYAPQNLDLLCKWVNDPSPAQACKLEQRKHFVQCTCCVAYNSSLSCGRFYAGQMGRCINDRLRENRSFFSAAPSGYLAVHYGRCACRAMLERSSIREALQK